MHLKGFITAYITALYSEESYLRKEFSHPQVEPEDINDLLCVSDYEFPWGVKIIMLQLLEYERLIICTV